MGEKKKISEKGKTKRRLLNRFSESQGNRVVRPFSHLPPPPPFSSSSTPSLKDDWYSFLNWLGRSLRLFRFLPYLKGSALRFLILSQDPKPFFPFSFPSISHQKNTIIRKLQNKNKKYWTYGEHQLQNHKARAPPASSSDSGGERIKYIKKIYIYKIILRWTFVLGLELCCSKIVKSCFECFCR